MAFEAAAVLQYSFVLTAAVTVVGWFIVAGQADRRERRKEVRENLIELRRRVEAVKDSAFSYWLGEGQAATIASITLKSDVLGLSHQAISITKLGIPLDVNLLIDIRKAATGGDFDKRGRRKTKADQLRLQELVGALEGLLIAANESFYRSFHKKIRMPWIFIPLLSFFGTAKDTTY